MGCAKAVMEAKYNYRMAIQEARMIRSNQLQEWETAYLEALGENAAARSTQSSKLHREHVKHMHELEEQVIREENKSRHDFLSACQAILLHALQPLEENLSTSYHILLGWLPSSLQSAPFARTPQAVEQPSATTSPRPEPKQSPWPKRQHLSPDPWGSTSMDETSSKASQEGPSSSKRRETPNWSASLKPSWADTFSHDSNPMKEARLHYFATHPCDWIHDSTSWKCWPTRQIHPWNTAVMGRTRGVKACQLCSLIPAQRVKVPKGGTHHGISKGHGTQRNSWPWCSSALCWLYLLSLVWKGGAKWGNHG